MQGPKEEGRGWSKWIGKRVVKSWMLTSPWETVEVLSEGDEKVKVEGQRKIVASCNPGTWNGKSSRWI